MATFLLISGGPHLLAILQNLSQVNMLRSKIKHEYALWVTAFVFLTSPLQMKQSGPGKDNPLTWRFPHHPMAQSLKSKFLLCDLPSFQNSLCVYWHMTEKTQIFSSPLLEGGISLQCIRVFKAEAATTHATSIERLEHTGKRCTRAADLPQPFYSLKYIITDDAIFCFFKFDIKVNVFWQQLVTRAPKEKRKVGPYHTVSIIDRAALDLREREREHCHNEMCDFLQNKKIKDKGHPIVLKTYEFDWQPANSLRSLVKEIKRQFFSLPKATCNLFRSPALVSQQASLPNQATQDNHNFKPSLLLARFLCQINAAEKLVLFLSFNNDNILISSLI